MTKKRQNAIAFFIFTFPALFTFALVVLVPFIMGIAYSFVEWNGLAVEQKVFVGLKNYKQLFHDSRFADTAIHTIIFTFISVLSINTVGLMLALLVTSKNPFNTIGRTMFFMPNLIGGLILGYIWKFILSDVFKAIGQSTGMESIFFNWLLKPNTALLSLILVITWQMSGYVMIIYVTGLTAIPDDVIEASIIDGAGACARFFRVTLPLIMPSITVCIFYTLSNCFKIYDINLSLTGGGPGTSTEMFSMNIYNEIFLYNNYGYGQAKAIIFFLLVAFITLFQVRNTKKREVQL